MHKQMPLITKIDMVLSLCFALVLILVTTITRGESCLPPSATRYKEIDKNSPHVQGLAEFAAKDLDYQLGSVICAGENKRVSGSNTYKLIIEIEDKLRPQNKRTCWVLIFDNRQKNTRFTISDNCQGWH